MRLCLRLICLHNPTNNQHCSNNNQHSCIKMKTPSEQYQHTVNLWAARIVPLVLVGVTGYSIWVVAYLLASMESITYEPVRALFRHANAYTVKYLLHPSPNDHDVQARPATAIAILVLYFFLLIPYIISYLRILQIIQTNPGYISKGTNRQEKEVNHLDNAAILDGSISPPEGIEQFYAKDVFVCDSNGIPIFCTQCNNWKPDRTHHCSEVGRCVRRMDHYCPWVGGIVSETTMKSFLQFTFYATLFCSFVFGVMIWAIVDRKRQTSHYDGNWIAIVAVAGLFGFMALGMFLTTMETQLHNLTSIERLGSYYYMAVYLPAGSERPLDPNGTTRCGFVTYPFQGSHTSRSRTFAIISVRPGDNPWDIGRLQNLKSVLGERYWEWILPLGYPPCCFHGRSDSDFPLGKDFGRLRREHFVPSNRRKHRRRRSSHGSRQSSHGS
jgi:palmitoyltransferase